MTTVLKATEGFLLAKSAAGRSPHTISDYEVNLRRFAEYSDGMPVAEFKSRDINAFFHFLRHEYKITHRGRQPIEPRPLSAKTVRNAWAALSSFWNWAIVEYELESNPFTVPCPKAKTRTIPPMSRDDVSRMYAIANRRDKALILVLMDTGARISELCHANIGDMDIKTGRLILTKTKGGRPRLTHMGRKARRALWSYLSRRDAEDTEPLFVDKTGVHRLTRNTARQIVRRLGTRAGVEGVHPHRFRHTMAIEYLRNGGDVFTLQQLLGHADLAMVRKYLSLATADIEVAHRRASPVDNWKL